MIAYYAALPAAFGAAFKTVYTLRADFMSRRTGKVAVSVTCRTVYASFCTHRICARNLSRIVTILANALYSCAVADRAIFRCVTQSIARCTFHRSRAMAVVAYLTRAAAFLAAIQPYIGS